MNDLVKSLDAYNIFNYLVPGVVMTVIASAIFEFNIKDINIFIGFFIFYFVGLIISRVGSLAVGPLLEWLKIIKKESYLSYINASKKDEKIELFSRYSSTYRTYAAMTLISLTLFLYQSLTAKESYINDSIALIVAVHLVVIVIFILSYRKQTSFITERIRHSSK